MAALAAASNSKVHLWEKSTTEQINGNPDLSITSEYHARYSITCESIGSETDGLDIKMADRGVTKGVSEVSNADDQQDKNTDVSLDFSSIHNMSEPKGVVENGSRGYEVPMNSAPYRRIEHPADKSLMLSFCGSLLFLLGSLIVFFPVAVLVIVLIPIIWFFRKIMSCCCCCAKHRACSICCDKTLTAEEAFWLHDTEFNKMVVQSLFVLEHGIDIVRIKDLINARLICAEGKNGDRTYPRFVQKVVPLYSGFAWQNDPDFSINNHVFAMPNSITTKVDLQKYMAEMSQQSLNLDRPLWDMHILTNHGPNKDTVILFRIHPSVCDGVNLLRILFKSVVDNQSVFTLKPRFGRGAYMFNMVRAVIIGPLVFLIKWIFTRKDYNLIHGPKLSGEKVVAWSEPFQFSRAMRVKQVTRSTLNDVILAVVSGNVRTYFETHGVENPYDMLATIPVDLSADKDDIKMGDVYTLVDLRIPTNTEGGIPRLWEIKHRMDELKNSVDPIVLYGSHWILQNMLPWSAYQKIWSSLVNKTSVLISNVPGPDGNLTFASREVKSLMTWMPIRGQVALSISVITYADQVYLTVICDKAVIPDPSVITQDFNFQMEKLCHLLANRRIPGELPGRRIDSLSNDDQPEPTMEELQVKMTEVQKQLLELKTRLDIETQAQYSAEERSLVNKVEELKLEFRDLLQELRRKKAGSDGSGVLSDDEDDDDGELRRPGRRRTLSASSRRSSCTNASSTSRPLTTSSQTPHCTPSSPNALKMVKVVPNKMPDVLDNCQGQDDYIAEETADVKL